MANEVLKVNSSLPPALQARMQKYAALLNSAEAPTASGPTFPRISANRRKFSILEAGAEPQVIMDGKHAAEHLDVVVVGWNPGIYKAYYEGEYDSAAKEKTAPVCWSAGAANMMEAKPSPASAKPQSTFCHNCPQNVFGSKINQRGKKIKACTDSKRILVVSPADMDGPIYMINLSAMALKGWNTYYKQLVREGLPLFGVVTRLTFDDDWDVPVFKLTYLDTLSAPMIEKALARMDDPDVQEFCAGTYDVETNAPRNVGTEEVEGTPAPGPKAAKEVPAKPEKPKPMAKARGFGATAPLADETLPPAEEDDLLADF